MLRFFFFCFLKAVIYVEVAIRTSSPYKGLLRMHESSSLQRCSG